ncbi:Hypothetical predicted protein [Pelobates cultripes]|uniref:Uncharacterized protein n=1 Tax=Pelobates cultripes TaxID=61616 RepID=A0AAD1S4L1_PELCU|nr:Hypothetical predicted protein [Pelobates cultripes]
MHRVLAQCLVILASVSLCVSSCTHYSVKFKGADSHKTQKKMRSCHLENNEEQEEWKEHGSAHCTITIQKDNDVHVICTNVPGLKKANATWNMTELINCTNDKPGENENGTFTYSNDILTLKLKNVTQPGNYGLMIDIGSDLIKPSDCNEDLDVTETDCVTSPISSPNLSNIQRESSIDGKFDTQSDNPNNRGRSWQLPLGIFVAVLLGGFAVYALWIHKQKTESSDLRGLQQDTPDRRDLRSYFGLSLAKFYNQCNY